MPMLVDVDPFGDWPGDLTADSPAAALEAAHEAYCLVAGGLAVVPFVSRRFSGADAARLLDRLRLCLFVFFSMEFPLGQPAPCYLAAFGSSTMGPLITSWVTGSTVV